MPSGLTTAVVASRPWPEPGIASRLTSSHSLTVLSTPAETMYVPSGLKATELIQSLWPRKLFFSSAWRFCTSHSLTT